MALGGDAGVGPQFRQAGVARVHVQGQRLAGLEVPVDAVASRSPAVGGVAFAFFFAAPALAVMLPPTVPLEQCGAPGFAVLNGGQEGFGGVGCRAEGAVIPGVALVALADLLAGKPGVEGDAKLEVKPHGSAPPGKRRSGGALAARWPDTGWGDRVPAVEMPPSGVLQGAGDSGPGDADAASEFGPVLDLALVQQAAPLGDHLGGAPAGPLRPLPLAAVGQC